MAWLSGTGHSLCHLFTHVDHHKKHPSSPHNAPPSTLGILSFETARIISRLVSLYRSLSDDEIHRLRTEVMRSRGVAYLNSRDETYLLSLAGAERMEDLNAAADAVARLSRKCSDHGPVGFGTLYADLRQGAIDTRRFEYECKNVAKIAERMEKLVSVTANLYAALESLTELEHSERNIHRWKKNLEAKQCGKATNFELFQQKIAFLRKQVQHYREISLWSQTFDRIVGFMARLVCVVFARVATVFGPYVSGLHLSPRCSRAVPNYCLLEERKFHHHRKWASKSGPTTHHEHCKKGLTLTSWLPWRKYHHHQHHHYHHHHHHHHRTFQPDDIPRLETASFDDYDSATGSDIGTNHNVALGLAPVSTVGGSALAVRYANVIITAERCLHTPDTVNDDTREGLYEMLPGRLRATVRSKLRSHWLKKKEELAEGCDGHALAMGWKDALEEMMTWLGPMAHDTLTWQAERNYERQRYLGGSKSTVLLLQTLHFSDLEKTEAAIVEVLVGLSCFQRYENNRRRSAADHHHFQQFRRRFS
ncbi:hypothetical protein PanWU01x14_351420 [Parasponia andersonii]|uniref:Avr9/Cf-9 rapidly elicited protein n=1 Tax=Parasponia andersonii TaxID=3476 RepID=A0A2P5AAP8_PARAD|nr:hypothetical protein PanWU01x14_351420 [Parasponia andersonii]